MVNLFDFTGFFGGGHALDTTAGTGIASLLNRIVSLMLAFAFPLAFIGLVVSAWKLISSAGDAAAMATAKKNIGYLAIGIFVLTLGLYAVKLIYSIFGNSA